MTRTAVGHTDYQELAFPCRECGIEVRYGMRLLLEKRLARIFAMGMKRGKAWIEGEMKRVSKLRNIQYTNWVNAKPCNPSPDIVDVVALDPERLNPAKEGELFSPYMATVFLPENREKYAMDERMRSATARIHGPQVLKLAIHFERRQWALFDKQIDQLDVGFTGSNELERISALFFCAEVCGRFFGDTHKCYRQVRERITFAENKSSALVKELADFLKAKKKDESIVKELWSIRKRWYAHYEFLAPIYVSFYWDDRKHSLADFKLPDKRFESLKQLYVDCFETFCRVSVIAAGFEGIVTKQALGVPTSKRLWAMSEFEACTNGNKPDVLRQLAVGDLFVPFIDTHLRNGVGHHSAHYNEDTDSVEYANENAKGIITRYSISYTEFCAKLIRLYGQLEAVSIYPQWIRHLAFR